MGVTAHSSGSLWLACVGVLEHALRLLTQHNRPFEITPLFLGASLLHNSA